MNRVIKFRAWDKAKNVWINESNEHPFYIIGETTVFGVLNQYSIDKLNDVVITQFTGLKDKNGKEIYESDICRIDGDFACVKFDEGSFWFIYNDSNGFTYSWAKHTGQWSDDIEVVGSIYQNKELLS